MDDLDYNAWLEVWTNSARECTLGYAGPINADVVVVGQLKSAFEHRAMPFTDKFGTEFAYNSLGDVALDLGWTWEMAVEPQLLRDRNGIIVCGNRAAKWIKYYVGGVDVLELPVPKYLLTRLSEPEVQDVYGQVRAFVESHTKEKKHG